MLIVLHHPILQTGTLRHRRPGEPPQVPLRGRARIQLRRCWHQRGASSPHASLSPHPPPTSPIWATLSPGKAFHLGHTPAALILTWWRGVQAVHLSFSAAPLATAESPTISPHSARWAHSALFTALSLHQLGAECPPWDAPSCLPHGCWVTPSCAFLCGL